MATGAAIVTAAVAVYSAYQSSKQAKKYTEAMRESTEWQQDIAYKQWKRYINTFAPLEDQLIETVQAPVEEQPGYNRMMAAIDRAYSDAGGSLRRMMGGRYPSGSDLETESMKNLELGRGRTKAGAIADLSQQRLANMMAIANLGRGLPAQAATGMANVTGAYSNLANIWGNAAQSSWGSLGNTMGNLMQMYMLINANKAGNNNMPYYQTAHQPPTGGYSEWGSNYPWMN